MLVLLVSLGPHPCKHTILCSALQRDSPRDTEGLRRKLLGSRRQPRFTRSVKKRALEKGPAATRAALAEWERKLM